eukprot:Hpha_TRINITY_DN15496_c0_g4::TRINITY_DN15496_c0_g4_i2::g.173358::m.173358
MSGDAFAQLSKALVRGEGKSLVALAKEVAKAAEGGANGVDAAAVLSAFGACAVSCGADAVSDCCEALVPAVRGASGVEAMRYLKKWCPLLLREWCESADAALGKALSGSARGVRIEIADLSGGVIDVRPAGAERWPLQGDNRIRGGEAVVVVDNSTGTWAGA